MEIEDGVPIRRLTHKDYALLIGMIVYCLFALILPVIGIIRAAKLIAYGSEILDYAIGAIGIGLVATAVNFTVGITFISFPFANYLVFSQLHMPENATDIQKKKIEKILTTSLFFLITLIFIAVFFVLYAFINIEAIPTTSGIIFIVLQALGLLFFVSGAISLFFLD